MTKAWHVSTMCALPSATALGRLRVLGYHQRGGPVCVKFEGDSGEGGDTDTTLRM